MNNVARNNVARLDSNGTLDDTFGHELAGANSRVFVLLPQSDGKTLIGGGFSSVNNAPRFGLAKLNMDGTLDLDFVPNSQGLVRAISLQRDGRILVQSGGIQRLNPDGSSDSTFSTHFPRSYTLGSDDKIYSNVNATGSSGTEWIRLHGGDLPPTELHLSSNRITELQPIGTTVGALTAMDDPFSYGSNAHIFTLVSGEGDEGNENFIIEDNVVKTVAVFDAKEQNTHSIRIRASNAKGLWIKQSFTVLVEPNLYAHWATVLPEDERSLSDDPGGHSISNLLRFAFGMNPLQPERAKLPQLGVTSGSPQTDAILTLTYSRRVDNDTLTYTPEVSTDLTAWTPFNGIEETERINAESETVTLTDSVSLDQSDLRFLRVRVER